jgi:hypothetical protein
VHSFSVVNKSRGHYCCEIERFLEHCGFAGANCALGFDAPEHFYVARRRARWGYRSGESVVEGQSEADIRCAAECGRYVFLFLITQCASTSL